MPKHREENKVLFMSDICKLPPQSIEFEQAVLGSIMYSKDIILNVIDILKPESFYKAEHQKIFEAIINLFAENKGIDILSVPEQLRKMGSLDEVGGVAYITLLTSNIASTYHVRQHALIVREKFIKRELIRYSSELQNIAYDDSIVLRDLQSYAQDEVYKILTDSTVNEAVSIDKVINSEIDLIVKIAHKEQQYTGIPSGYKSLDKLTSGWQNSDLIILAARPSMGKTAISIWFAINPVLLKIPVLYFSLEMSKEQIARRIISYKTGINSMNLNNGLISDHDIENMCDRMDIFNDVPFYVDDTPALSIFEMQSRVKKYVMKYGIKMIIVDYLQLMQGEKGGTRENEVSSISRGLKAIAKQTNIPVIALSQLNRSTEIRKGKPQLSDLRESGAIEQDADMVIFIDRPSRRGVEQISGKSTNGMTILNIAKYRNGIIGDVTMYNSDSFNDFSEEIDEFNSYYNPDRFVESEKPDF